MCHHQTTSAETFYVNSETGNNNWNGKCPEWDEDECGPVASITMAISLATDDDSIIVADGEYSGANFGGKSIFLSSQNGSENCLLDGALILGSGEDALVDGFTLTGPWVEIRASGDDQTIKNCVVNGASETGITGTGANLTVAGCKIRNSPKGGINVSGDDSTISGCTVSDVTDTGIRATGNNQVVSNCTVSGASLGIRAGGENTRVTGCAVTSCERGVEVASNAIPARMSASNISGSTTGAGVTIYGNAVVDGCTISNNLNVGVHLYSSAQLINSTVEENHVAGILVWDVEDCEISQTTIENNYDSGVSMQSGRITDCDISGNEVGLRISGTASATNCNIFSNSTEEEGGGVSIAGEAQLISCTINNNTARWGGGVACSENATLKDCRITDNTATNAGGGIYFGFENTATVINSQITNNQCPNQGGGVAVWEGTPKFYGCLIAANSAPYGAAVTDSSDANHRTMFVNCTITANVGSNDAAVSGSVHGPVITNCILKNYVPDELNTDDGRSPWVTYSSIRGGWPGQGNIAADPGFVDYAGGDYRLTAGSTCIDGGNGDALPSIITTDIRGATRRVEDQGMPNGGKGAAAPLDLGAYEWQGTTDEFVLIHPVPGLAGKTSYLQVAGASPNGLVFFGYGMRAGSTNVPICGGLIIDIKNPKLAGDTRVNGSGQGELKRMVPPGVSGRNVLIQAVDKDACAVSNLVAYWFP